MTFFWDNKVKVYSQFHDKEIITQVNRVSELIMMVCLIKALSTCRWSVSIVL